MVIDLSQVVRLAWRDARAYFLLLLCTFFFYSLLATGFAFYFLLFSSPFLLGGGPFFRTSIHRGFSSSLQLDRPFDPPYRPLENLRRLTNEQEGGVLCHEFFRAS